MIKATANNLPRKKNHHRSRLTGYPKSNGVEYDYVCQMAQSAKRSRAEQEARQGINLPLIFGEHLPAPAPPEIRNNYAFADLDIPGIADDAAIPYSPDLTESLGN